MPPIATLDDSSVHSTCNVYETKLPAVIISDAEEPHRKTLRFTEHVFVYDFEPEDVTRDEIWFCRDEYARMRQECVMTCRAFREGTFRESSSQTMLGLERNIGRNFKDIRAISRMAVLKEQDRQTRAGTFVPKLLALDYSVTTKESKQLARGYAECLSREVSRFSTEPASISQDMEPTVQSTPNALWKVLRRQRISEARRQVSKFL